MLFIRNSFSSIASFFWLNYVYKYHWEKNENKNSFLIESKEHQSLSKCEHNINSIDTSHVWQEKNKN
jgi:hypothetical protein